MTNDLAVRVMMSLCRGVATAGSYIQAVSTRGGVLVRCAAAGGVLGAVGRDDDDEAAREWRAWRRWPIS